MFFCGLVGRLVGSFVVRCAWCVACGCDLGLGLPGVLAIMMICCRGLLWVIC